MNGPAARIGAFILALLMLAVGWFGGLHDSGNYHEVLAGELYRSGQLAPEALARRVKLDGIRSVVNLRGPQTGRAWYDAEIAATQAMGIAHFDVPLLSSKPLSQADADQLVAVMRQAPKPMLVHCEGGADRTGLAVALYLAASGRPLDEAARALSIRYGFVGIKGVTRPWPMMESWLRLGPRVGSGQASASISAP